MEEFRGKCKSCNGIGVVYDGIGVWRCRLCNKDFTSEEIENYLYDEAIRERDALKAENEKLKKVVSEMDLASIEAYKMVKKDLEEAVRIAKRDHPQNCGQCFDSGILRTGSPCSDGIFLSRFPVENKKEDGK